MSSSDAVGLGVCSSFGLWWAILPQSVIGFYTWLLRCKLRRMPEPAVVRVIVVLWIALMVRVTIFAAQR